MAYSKGGSKTNLIEGYRLGEDVSYSYGKNRHLAQTFTLNQLYAVWRCLFKSWTNQGEKFYHYAIKETDATGKPTGADICHTTLSPTGEVFYSPGKWRRFDFDEFPLLGPGIYALVASVPDAFANWRYKLRCDATAPTYADGKAWVSNDAGTTWTEIPNTDFMFEVWGYSPPPDAPPPPSISNWAVPAINIDDLPDGVKIQVNTDILCHLYMRWTITEPEVHNIQVYRRGLAIRLDKRFCFVTWHENEQEEDGDTLIHTFTKRPWAICETRWFYFVGTVAQEQQPSTSPIFSKHFEGVEMYVISLGKLAEVEILHGHVKLKEGAGITITRDDPNNALEIAATVTPYQGFGNDWEWFASDGSPLPAGTFFFDCCRQTVTRLGQDYHLYTPSHPPYGLDDHQALEFRIGRVTPLGGTPHLVVGITLNEHNIIDNLTTEGIWFRLSGSQLYAENADGANRTSTMIKATDMINPHWYRWERQAAQIQFFEDGVLMATHNTNLPAAPKNCIFVFQIRGVDNFARTFAISHPIYSQC